MENKRTLTEMAAGLPPRHQHLARTFADLEAAGVRPEDRANVSLVLNLLYQLPEEHSVAWDRTLKLSTLLTAPRHLIEPHQVPPPSREVAEADLARQMYYTFRVELPANTLVPLDLESRLRVLMGGKLVVDELSVTAEQVGPAVLQVLGRIWAERSVLRPLGPVIERHVFSYVHAPLGAAALPPLLPDPLAAPAAGHGGSGGGGGATALVKRFIGFT